MVELLDEPLDWRWYAGVGVATFAASALFGLVGLGGVPVRAGLAGAMFAFLGVLCLANGTACGSTHCIVSGPPYLALGAGSILVALGVLSVPMDRIWIAFVVVLVVAFALEWMLDNVRRRPRAV